MGKRGLFVLEALGVREVRPPADATKACRKSVRQRIVALPPGKAIPAVVAARELIIRRCRSCGGCWMAGL